MFDLPDRQSIRLRGYDYSQNGLYFVTICTHNRENLFGEIVGVGRDRPECGSPEMKLNKFGGIVQSIWESLPKHHRVGLDCFQIMPNHVHFNILLMGELKNETGASRPNETGASRRAPTLGMVVGFLKSESTKQIRQIVGATRGSPDGLLPRGSPDGKSPVWQRNYYEHIIRNETEYNKICYYINNNPKMWDRDKNNSVTPFV